MKKTPYIINTVNAKGIVKKTRHYIDPKKYERPIQIQSTDKKGAQACLTNTGNVEHVKRFLKRESDSHALNFEMTNIPLWAIDMFREDISQSTHAYNYLTIDFRGPLSIKEQNFIFNNSTFYDAIFSSGKKKQPTEKSINDDLTRIIPTIVSLCIAIKSNKSVRSSRDSEYYTKLRFELYPIYKDGKPKLRQITTGKNKGDFVVCNDQKSKISEINMIWYNMYNFRKIKLLQDTLKDYGFVKLVTGKVLFERGVGYQTRMIPQQKLIDIYNKYKNRMDFSTLNYRRNVETSTITETRVVDETNQIRIKNKNKEIVSQENYTPDMIKQIKDENANNKIVDINYIYKKTGATIKVFAIKDNRDITNKLSAQQAGIAHIDNDGRLVYDRFEMRRIYNDETLDHGGRLYNNYQQDSKIARASYTINDYPVTSLDMQASQISMLYNLEGLVSTCRDPYNLYEDMIHQFSEEFLTLSRKLTKTMSLTMINASNFISALQSIYYELEFEKHNFSKLKKLKTVNPNIPDNNDYSNDYGIKYATLDQRKILFDISKMIYMIKKKHTLISKYFHSNYGIVLQKKESEVVIDTIITMHRKYKTPAFSVHDEIIIQKDYSCQLYDEFQSNYKKHFDFECVLTDPSNIDFKTTETYISYKHNQHNQIKENNFEPIEISEEDLQQSINNASAELVPEYYNEEWEVIDTKNSIKSLKGDSQLTEQTKNKTNEEMEEFYKKYLFSDENGNYVEHIDTTPEEKDTEMYESIFTDEQLQAHEKILEKHNLSESAKSAEAKNKKLQKQRQDKINLCNLDTDLFNNSLRRKPAKIVKVMELKAGGKPKRSKEEQDEIDNFDWDKYLEKHAKDQAAKPKKYYY